MRDNHDKVKMENSAKPERQVYELCPVNVWYRF